MNHAGPFGNTGQGNGLTADLARIWEVFGKVSVVIMAWATSVKPPGATGTPGLGGRPYAVQGQGLADNAGGSW